MSFLNAQAGRGMAKHLNPSAPEVAPGVTQRPTHAKPSANYYRIQFLRESKSVLSSSRTQGKDFLVFWFSRFERQVMKTHQSGFAYPCFWWALGFWETKVGLAVALVTAQTFGDNRTFSLAFLDKLAPERKAFFRHFENPNFTTTCETCGDSRCTLHALSWRQCTQLFSLALQYAQWPFCILTTLPGSHQRCTAVISNSPLLFPVPGWGWRCDG